MFNVKKATNDCIQWIRDWREENGPGCNFIVGISGGVDSLVAAELCVEAIGADKVLGVIMPNREQDDIDVAYDICQYVLGIDYLTINVGSAYDDIIDQIDAAFNVTDQTLINLAPRLRMATLYGYHSHTMEEWLIHVTLVRITSDTPLDMVTQQETFHRWLSSQRVK